MTGAVHEFRHGHGLQWQPPQPATPDWQSSPDTTNPFTDVKQHREHRVSQTISLVDCIQGVPDDVRSSLANYFATGRHECLTFTEHNFQFYFSIAQTINHDKLMQICSQFYFKHKVLLCHKLSGIDCQTLLRKHASNANKKTYGVKRKCPADDGWMVYAVLFITRPTMKHKQQVTIVDTSEKQQVVQQTLNRSTSSRLQPGFASCTMYSKDCPYIVICGGYGKNGTCFGKFDVVENRWSRKSCKMNAKRLNHVVAYANGSVYIVGGQDCATVEVYNQCKNNCHVIGSLPVPVSCMAYETHKDKLYVFGGKTSKGDVACVQCIDTKSNAITRLPDLPSVCSGGQAVAMGDAIYIATAQGHMIKFNPSTGESVLCAHQPFKRKNFAIFTRHEHVFILGGVPTDVSDVTPTDTDVNTMYTYSPDRDCWKPDISLKSGLEMSIYSSCTVRYPRKIAIYPFDSNR